MSFTLSDGGVQISNISILGPTPGAPGITAATQIGIGQVQIDYTAPIFKGSSIITRYFVVSSPGNITASITTFASGSIVLSGLTDRQIYVFIVYAENSYGFGATAISAPVQIYPAKPDEPIIVSVSQQGWGANISYTAPLLTGLSQIQSYTGISTPDSITKTVNKSGSGYIVIGDNTTKLTVGTPYTFTAHATNSYGDSIESNASTSLILTRPTADGPTLVPSTYQTDLNVYLTVIPPTRTAVQAPVTTYSVTYNGGTTTGSPFTTRTVNSSILACRTAVPTVESAGPYTLTVGGIAAIPVSTTYPNSYVYPYSPFMGAIASNFNGSNYLIGPTKRRLINTGPFSIECWIKPANPVTGTDQCIVQNFDWNGGNNSGFVLWLTGSGKIRLEATDGVFSLTISTQPTVIESNYALPVNTLYALRFTNTATNGSQMITGQLTTQAILTVGPFTIEAWIKPNQPAVAVDMLVVENARWSGGNAGGFRVYVTTANTIRLDVVNGTWNTFPTVLTSTTSIPNGDYTHVAITRDNNNDIRIFLNGVVDDSTVNNSSNFSNIAYNSGTGGLGTLRIGASQTDSTYPNPFQGFISNLRIVPGVAVYTVSFTVPNFLLSATQSASTNIGAIGPVIPSDGYSVLFNANINAKQYLTVPYNSIFDIPVDTQWTIECWVLTSSTNAFIIANRNWNYGTGGPTWGFSLQGGVTPQWDIAGSGSASFVLATSTLSGTLGRWNHYAFTRDSLNVVRIFVNGRVGVTRTDNRAMTNVAGPVFIGVASNLNNSSYSSGHISNLRIVKNQALYTTNFTPSTSPLTKTSQGAIASNVILLICQGTTLSDNGTGNSGSTFTLSAFGNINYVNTPIITKHYSPFGTQAVLLAGQSSSATNDNSGLSPLSGGNGGVVLFHNKWYHIAVSRDIYNVVRIFVDGVADTNTVTYPASLSLRATQSVGNPGPTFRIGARVKDSSVSNNYTGLLSDLRIIQGYYRSNNFSLPTELSNASETLSNIYPIFSLPSNTYTFTGVSTNIYGPGPSGPTSSALIVSNSQIEWRNTGALFASTNITTTWTVPAGVTSISAVVIGGGGGRGYFSTTAGGGGGGGGGLSYANTISVNPGEVLTVQVGISGWAAASGNTGKNGGTSSIARANGSIIISATGGLTTYNTATGGTGGIGLTGTNVEGETVVGFNGRQGTNGSGATYGQGGSAATYTATPTTTLIGQDLFGSSITSGLAGNGGTNNVGSVSPIGYGAVRIVWPGDIRKYPDTDVSTNL